MTRKWRKIKACLEPIEINGYVHTQCLTECFFDRTLEKLKQDASFKHGTSTRANLSNIRRWAFSLIVYHRQRGDEKYNDVFVEIVLCHMYDNQVIKVVHIQPDTMQKIMKINGITHMDMFVVNNRPFIRGWYLGWDYKKPIQRLTMNKISMLNASKLIENYGMVLYASSIYPSILTPNDEIIASDHASKVLEFCKASEDECHYGSYFFKRKSYFVDLELIKTKIRKLDESYGKLSEDAANSLDFLEKNYGIAFN